MTGKPPQLYDLDFEATLLAAACLEEEAKGAGLSWDTMKRAKDKLGIIARRDGKAQKWTWVLPARAREQAVDRPEANA